MRIINSFILFQRRLHRFIYDFKLLIFASLILLTVSHVLIPFRVEGESMTPTLKNSSVHICFRAAYWWNEPKRGDIVLATADELLVKRILAFPGETISFKNGQTFINDTYLVEPHMNFKWDWNMEAIKIKPDHVFIVGDNREMKIHQHSFGQVPKEWLLGKVVY